MDLPAEIVPTAPQLAVQHAARVLRGGGRVRLDGNGPTVDALAAETLSEGDVGDWPSSLPRGTVLVLTGQRLRSLDLPVAVDRLHLLPLARSDVTGRRVMQLADPTVAGVDAKQILALAVPTDRADAAAAIELCKLAGLLPAAILMPPVAPVAEVATIPISAVTAYRRLVASSLRPVSEARVPLAEAENVRIVSFRPADGGAEQFAILVGEPERIAAPLARLHSECFTGDFLGSLRCDCGDQLRGAIRRMAHEGGGVLLYLAQEGRGIGLTNKLRAYMLQDSGLDTVEANHHLGFGSDERDFSAAAEMLRQLGIGRVRLLTNNPAKIVQLQQHGIEIVGRVPHMFEANRHNRRYLQTKAARSGHLLAVDDAQPAPAGMVHRTCA